MQPSPRRTFPNAPSAERGSGPFWASVLREMRPKQWLKNGLLLFGLVYAREAMDYDRVQRALIAFAAFCLISSAGYIFNDLRDLQLDRLHPTKRFRPLASGAISPRVGSAVAITLLGLGGLLAWSLGWPFVASCLAYAAITGSYSLWLKHVVLLDAFGIAGGFVVRAVAGAIAVDVPVSPWLYVCTILGSLVIALGKRRSELGDDAFDAEAHRPTLENYTPGFLDQLIVITASASVMAYSLYTFFADNVPKNHLMMVTIPVVLYGVFRYLFLVQVKGRGGSPEELLLQDRSLATSVVLFLSLSGAILYLGPR